MTLDKFGIVELYPTTGSEWYSTAWYNGHARTVIPDRFDPYDSKLGVTSSNLRIHGNGEATASPRIVSQGHRVYVKGKWHNTETTIFAKVRGTCPSLQIRSRSNHHGPQKLPYGVATGVPNGSSTISSCGFGNYLVKWSQHGDNMVSVELEGIHNLYRRKLNRHSSIQPPKNQWTGYKQVTRDYGNNIKVEGWILRNVFNQSTWFKDIEFVFDGYNATIDITGKSKILAYCADKGDKISGNLNCNQIWHGYGLWSWVRLEGDIKDVDLKYYSVREI